jgi:hypothetical protein
VFEFSRPPHPCASFRSRMAERVLRLFEAARPKTELQSVLRPQLGNELSSASCAELRTPQLRQELRHQLSSVASSVKRARSASVFQRIAAHRAKIEPAPLSACELSASEFVASRSLRPVSRASVDCSASQLSVLRPHEFVSASPEYPSRKH